MDTGHAQDFENYVNDLVSGRLPVQAEHRVDVQPLSVTGDDTFRLGESNRRILELQRVMSEEGYRAAGGEELDQDGVYRPGMQGALLDFQRAHGLPQTGNIDPARSEEHTSELQSLMRISYAGFCLTKRKITAST